MEIKFCAMVEYKPLDPDGRPKGSALLDEMNGKKGSDSGGFLAKAIEFAKENPIVAVMAALFVLGIIIPEKKK